MPRYTDWQADLATKEVDFIRRVHEAICVLRLWPMFAQNYPELVRLQAAINEELICRE